MSLWTDARDGWRLFSELRRLSRKARLGRGAAEGSWLIPRHKIAGWNERSNTLDFAGGYEELAAARPPAALPTASRLDALSSSPTYPPLNARSMLGLGYLKNEVVRAAFDLILDAQAQALPELQDADGQSVKGRMAEEFTQLLACPSGPDSDLTGADLTDQGNLDMLASGNSMLEMVPGAGTSGRPVRLWRLDPSRVSVLPATEEQQATSRGDRRIDHYLYRVGGQWYPIPYQQVIHWRQWDNTSEFFGSPKLYSALRSLAADSDLVDLLKVTLENMGVVPHVLEYPMAQLAQQIAAGNATFVPNHEQLTEVRDRFAERYTKSNRGKPYVAWGWQVKAIGLNFAQLAIGDLVATTERRVAGALGVPMILLNQSGTSGADPGHNWTQAREQFHHGTIAGSLRRKDAVWTGRLAPHFVEGGRIVHRTDHMAVFRDARLRRLKDAATAMHVVPRHTVQRLIGEAPTGPNVFYRPAGVLAIPAEATTEVMMEDEALETP